MGKRRKKKKKKGPSPHRPVRWAIHPAASDGSAPLSLCMIVKNESRFLPDCLASVRDLVREIIVVDTGSTDNTVAIAQQYGAKVFHYTWENDFAKARNVALSKATQPWILYLDADERLYPQYHDTVKKAILSNQADAFYVNVLSYLNGKLGKVPHTQSYPRIFKKLPGIQFEGKIHEQITPSLKRVGARVKTLNVVIEHLGYNLPPEEIEKKIARNLQFLEEQVAEEPENWYALFQLGQTYIVDDQIEKGMALLKKLLTFDEVSVPIAASALTIIGNQLFLQKQYPEAREYLQKAIAIAPKQRLGYFILSEIEAALQNWAVANTYLEKYLQYETAPFSDLGVDKILDHKLIVFRLARNWVNQHDYHQAAQALMDNLITRGDIDEEVLGHFLTIIGHLKDPRAISRFVHQLLPHIPRSRESDLYFRMIATFCQEQGLSELEEEVLDQAIEYFPQHAQFWYAKGNVAAQRNHYAEALAAFQRAISLSPTLYEAYYNAAVLSMKAGDFSRAIEWFERIAAQFPQYANEANRRIAALLIKSGNLQEGLKRLGIHPGKAQEVLKVSGDLPNI